MHRWICFCLWCCMKYVYYIFGFRRKRRMHFARERGCGNVWFAYWGIHLHSKNTRKFKTGCMRGNGQACEASVSQSAIGTQQIQKTYREFMACKRGAYTSRLHVASFVFLHLAKILANRGTSGKGGKSLMTASSAGGALTISCSMTWKHKVRIRHVESIRWLEVAQRLK